MARDQRNSRYVLRSAHLIHLANAGTYLAHLMLDPGYFGLVLCGERVRCQLVQAAARLLRLRPLQMVLGRPDVRLGVPTVPRHRRAAIADGLWKPIEHLEGGCAIRQAHRLAAPQLRVRDILPRDRTSSHIQSGAAGAGRATLRLEAQRARTVQGRTCTAPTLRGNPIGCMRRCPPPLICSPVPWAWQGVSRFGRRRR